MFHVYKNDDSWFNMLRYSHFNAFKTGSCPLCNALKSFHNSSKIYRTDHDDMSSYF